MLERLSFIILCFKTLQIFPILVNTYLEYKPGCLHKESFFL